MTYEGWVDEPGDVTRYQRYLCGIQWNDYAIGEIRKIAHTRALGLWKFKIETVLNKTRKRFWSLDKIGNVSGQNQKRF